MSSYVYTDDSITFGYANTEAQVLSYEDAPLLSVVAPLEINPQMIMWDPDTYPDVKSIADLGEAGITINVFGGGVFSEVFVAQGIWSADQIDPSYDGSRRDSSPSKAPSPSRDSPRRSRTTTRTPSLTGASRSRSRPCTTRDSRCTPPPSGSVLTRRTS